LRFVRRDPHRVLGVPPNASPEQLHDAYRRLVKQHHPDHNGGSPEATQRFQEIQEAYDELRNRPAAARPAQAAWDSVADRMQTLERELREAQAARERARAAAREAARNAEPEEPAPSTSPAAGEDSFGRILGDVRDELGDRLSEARKHPAVKRVSDLIDGLDDLASKLDRK
jgi:curved DNA-binding protein CbpA